MFEPYLHIGDKGVALWGQVRARQFDLDRWHREHTGEHDDNKHIRYTKKLGFRLTSFSKRAGSTPCWPEHS